MFRQGSVNGVIEGGSGRTGSDNGDIRGGSSQTGVS